MINFKKGSALSLHQVNYVGSPTTTVTAGQVVRVTQTGSGYATVTPGNLTDRNNATTLLGFAINSSTQGDSIESGKVGVFALDGGSVIETDQFDATSLPPATVTAGTPVTAGTDGLVYAWSSGNKVIGWVEGVRSIPGKENQTTTTTLTDPVTGNSRTRTFSYQPTNITVLGIKLAS
jgi:hypothetical protein